MLLSEGAGSHISKGYVYAAMVFALVVELLNMRARRGKDSVKREQLRSDAEEAAIRHSIS